MSADRLAKVDDEQVVRLRAAIDEPRPVTRGPATVFDLAGPRTPRARESVSAPDPAALAVVKGPPGPLLQRNPPSPWQAVWNALKPGGDGRAMTPEQAKAFARWARQHGHSGKLTRRKIDGATSHVWRKA